MKVIITGDREWRWVDQDVIRDRLALLPPDTIIVHGMCRGVDEIAGYAAKDLGLEVREYPADWKRYGRAAGGIRNGQMLEEEWPIDLVLGFHNDIKNSKGTKDMLIRAKRAKVPWELNSISDE